LIQRLPQQTNAYHNQPTKHYYHYTTNETTLPTKHYYNIIMAYNTAAPEYTLVIKRAFGDNEGRNGKIRHGTTKDDVSKVMNVFGPIERIDCIEKKDYRNNENFRIFFVHYTNVSTMAASVRTALDNSKDIEVDNDDRGHFWLVTKYNKPAEKTKTQKTPGVRIRARITPPPPLVLTDNTSPITAGEYTPHTPPAAPTGDGRKETAVAECGRCVGPCPYGGVIAQNLAGYYRGADGAWH
jgi:hypothetical protein